MPRAYANEPRIDRIYVHSDDQIVPLKKQNQKWSLWALLSVSLLKDDVEVFSANRNGTNQTIVFIATD